MNGPVRRSRKVTETEKLAKAALRFEVRFRKAMVALDHLGRLKVLDAEWLIHTRLILEHCRARIGLDVAEAAQQCELQNCNYTDRLLRELERATMRTAPVNVQKALDEELEH